MINRTSKPRNQATLNRFIFFLIRRNRTNVMLIKIKPNLFLIGSNHGLTRFHYQPKMNEARIKVVRINTSSASAYIHVYPFPIAAIVLVTGLKRCYGPPLSSLQFLLSSTLRYRVTFLSHPRLSMASVNTFLAIPQTPARTLRSSLSKIKESYLSLPGIRLTSSIYKDEAICVRLGS